MTRGVLAATGFVRKEVGGTVYFEAGAGEAIVLVHGVNDQAGTWFAVAPALARTHRVIVPDLPGHGESAPKEGPLPLPLFVEQLHAVIEASNATQITLVGNSLGGWLAMLYTLAHRDRVARLVLEASGGLARPLKAPLTASNREQALQILKAVHGPKFEAPEWTIEAVLERAKDAPMLRMTDLLPHYLERRLAEIDVPTTVIWGADDGVVPRDYAEALRDGIRGARFEVIEGAAHIPHVQQPERFLACLTATS